MTLGISCIEYYLSVYSVVGNANAEKRTIGLVKPNSCSPVLEGLNGDWPGVGYVHYPSKPALIHMLTGHIPN